MAEDYRVAYAGNPGPPGRKWGVLRLVKNPTVARKTWECTDCESELHLRVDCLSTVLPQAPLRQICLVLVRAALLTRTANVSNWSGEFGCPESRVSAAADAAGNKKSCAHYDEAKSTRALPSADFERQFDVFFDASTGKRRLTCLSRQLVPEQIQESSRAQEWRGTDVHVVMHSRIPCSNRDAQASVNAGSELRARGLTVVTAQASCPANEQILTACGQSHVLLCVQLRQKAGARFHHCCSPAANLTRAPAVAAA